MPPASPAPTVPELMWFLALQEPAPDPEVIAPHLEVCAAPRSGMAVTDAEGCLTLVSPSLARWIGRPPKELVGCPAVMLFPDEQRTALEEWLHRCLAGTLAPHATPLRQGLDWALLSPTLIRQERDGAPRHLLLQVTDLTSQKQAEARADLLARAGRALIDTLDPKGCVESLARLPVPHLAYACVVDLHARGEVGRAAWVSDAQASSTALSEALGSSGSHLPPLVGEVCAAAAPHRALTQAPDTLASHPAHAEALAALDPASILIVPLRIQSGAPGALTLIRRRGRPAFNSADTATAEHLAELGARALQSASLHREAVRARRARDHLLEMLSHDLRSPLAAARTAVSLLDRRLPPESRNREDIRRVLDLLRDHAEAGLGLMRDVLDAARAEASELAMEAAPTEVGPLVVDLVSRHRELAQDRGIRLETALHDPSARVLGDPDRLVQVLENLLGNALKFTSAGQPIRLTTEATDAGIRFSVSDRGPGIPDDQLPHLFERFWQGDRSRPGGAGLGLAIAHRIVEAHGGTMGVESEVGAGSTFWFLLPTP